MYQALKKGPYVIRMKRAPFVLRRLHVLAVCLIVWALVVTTDSFAASVCDTDDISTWSDCVGNATLPDGATYSGEWLNGLMHGQGEYAFPTGSQWSGDRYKGEFHEGVRQGFGAYFYANGDVYKGEWNDGKENGLGTYIFGPNSRWAGDKYVGAWRAGEKHGVGTYRYANGDTYEGEWVEGAQTGKGTYRFGKKSKWAGATYEGDWLNGRRHGLGKYTSGSGEVYDGEWEHGKFVGTRPQETTNKTSPARMQEAGDRQKWLRVSSGSSFAVNRNGHLVTNAHVVTSCEHVEVQVPSGRMKATVLGTDRRNDLALIKIDYEPKRSYMLRTETPHLGEDIFLAGFPYGDSFSSSVKVTKGIVSALTGVDDNTGNFQVDAALQKGNSGGPIVDPAGYVIGIAAAKLSAEFVQSKFGTDSFPENINFGIKASVLRSFLESNHVEFVEDTDMLGGLSENRRVFEDTILNGTFFVTCHIRNPG